ncbi:MAG: septum formation initiator family protein [Planctomycetes bacterium]|nr:septum formation initiator family protein [Planctomycetota bacterium]
MAFWVSLFVAAGLYATVVLSPKLLAYLALNREYVANQWRLSELSRQVAHFDRVIQAQTHDPAFVREQARDAFDVAPPEEQRIPVDSHLRLNIELGPRKTAIPAKSLPWYASVLRLVANSRSLGTTLLCGAGALVVCAFSFLYERRSAITVSRGPLRQTDQPV